MSDWFDAGIIDNQAAAEEAARQEAERQDAALQSDAAARAEAEATWQASLQAQAEENAARELEAQQEAMRVVDAIQSQANAEARAAAAALLTDEEYKKQYDTGLATTSTIMGVVGSIFGGIIGGLFGGQWIAGAALGYTAGNALGSAVYQTENQSPESVHETKLNTPVAATNPAAGTQAYIGDNGEVFLNDGNGGTYGSGLDAQGNPIVVPGVTDTPGGTDEPVVGTPPPVTVTGNDPGNLTPGGGGAIGVTPGSGGVSTPGGGVTTIVDTPTIPITAGTSGGGQIYTGGVGGVDHPILTPVVPVGGGTYGPAVTPNVNYQVLSDEEQIRLAIEKGNFAEQAGQAILAQKVEEKIIEGNIRYKAAARGLRYEGSPLYQMQAQRQTANQAIGYMERGLAGAVAGMEWTAQAAKDRAQFAMNENIYDINFQESENQMAAWTNFATGALGAATSALQRYWNPAQRMTKV